MEKHGDAYGEEAKWTQEAGRLKWLRTPADGEDFAPLFCPSIQPILACNIFTRKASDSRDPAALRTATRFVAVTGLITVAIPVFGFFAPYLTTFALGPQWDLAGRVAADLSVMGAAQALASP